MTTRARSQTLIFSKRWSSNDSWRGKSHRKGEIWTLKATSKSATSCRGGRKQTRIVKEKWKVREAKKGWAIRISLKWWRTIWRYWGVSLRKTSHLWVAWLDQSAWKTPALLIYQNRPPDNTSGSHRRQMCLLAVRTQIQTQAVSHHFLRRWLWKQCRQISLQVSLRHVWMRIKIQSPNLARQKLWRGREDL